MKAIPGILLLCASLAFADVPADRASDRTDIAQVINSPSTAKLVSALFTAGDDSQPLSEVTPPHIAIQSIRFLTPEVALVDATSTQFGTMILVRRVPIWLVMKKEGPAWKIASLRLPAASDFV
jgi:hypothetical protein